MASSKGLRTGKAPTRSGFEFVVDEKVLYGNDRCGDDEVLGFAQPRKALLIKSGDPVR